MTPNPCKSHHRRPLSEISPNAKSPPIPIPRISVSCLEDDEVFDESIKENLNPGCSSSSSRQVLFPSYGTSPSHAFKIEEGIFEHLTGNLTDNQQIKRLGKGSFGTVLLGIWKGKNLSLTKLVFPTLQWIGIRTFIGSFQEKILLKLDAKMLKSSKLQGK